MKPVAKVVSALVAVVVAASWLPDGRPTGAEPVDVRTVDAPGRSGATSVDLDPPAANPGGRAPASAAQPPPATAAAALLRAAGGGDGDSWRDASGREYRLGMVNAPESAECFGAQATAERQRMVAAGFRPEVYSVDRHGREVAVVTTADGTNLNVTLARHGFADDRYLAQFRQENPALAEELDTAFASAKADRAGLWGACGQAAPQGIVAAPPAKKPAPAAGGSCHPQYVTCIPVKGDGSGRGQANDLDCGDIGRRVQLQRGGADPYRLDGSDDDGYGCE